MSARECTCFDRAGAPQVERRARTVLSVAGEGYQLLRVYPDGAWFKTDTVPVIAFVVDPERPPQPVTATGDTIESEDYVGALVLPDGRVFKPGFEFGGFGLP